MADDLARTIAALLARRGVSATTAQTGALTAYIGHLAKWNHTINLTSLDLAEGLESSLDRLVVEPCLAARTLRESAAELAGRGAIRLLDLGSGGGSPGVPLAIALETDTLVMVESKERKAAFLRDALRMLGWSGSSVIQGRTDDLWSGGISPRSMDVISVRALSMSPADWRGAASVLAPDGRVLWFRSAAQPADGTTPLTVERTANLDDVGSQVSLLKLQN